MNSTEFVTDLISQLKLSKVNLNRLVLELPEKTALDNMQQVLSNIALLQNNGIGIALDDFGMEYSNKFYCKNGREPTQHSSDQVVG